MTQDTPRSRHGTPIEWLHLWCCNIFFKITSIWDSMSNSGCILIRIVTILKNLAWSSNLYTSFLLCKPQFWMTRITIQATVPATPLLLPRRSPPLSCCPSVQPPGTVGQKWDENAEGNFPWNQVEGGHTHTHIYIYIYSSYLGYVDDTWVWPSPNMPSSLCYQNSAQLRLKQFSV